MTTLAADKPRTFADGDIDDIPSVAADIIYEGAYVGDDGSGYGRPLVAGDPFRGIAELKCDNSGGSAGAKRVRVRRRGLLRASISGLAITDLQKPVYASDDDTLTLTAGSNTHVGRVVTFISTGYGLVAFNVDRGGIGKVAALTEAAGAIGGSSDGDLPDLTATFVARTGQTGTANGAYEAVGATNSGDVSGAIANNIRELDTVVTQLAADDAALRAAVRELATTVNRIARHLA